MSREFVWGAKETCPAEMLSAEKCWVAENATVAGAATLRVRLVVPALRSELAANEPARRFNVSLPAPPAKEKPERTMLSETISFPLPPMMLRDAPAKKDHVYAGEAK